MATAQTTVTPSPSFLTRITSIFTSSLFGKLEGVDRRNSVLLAWITLVLLIGILMNLMFGLRLVVVIAAVITFGAHIVSRTRYYKVAGILLIVAASIPSFSGLISADSSEYSRDWVAARIIWLALPLTLASAFLSRRTVAIMGGLTFGALALLPVMLPELDFSLLPGALGFVGIMVVFVQVAMNHRDQIETERQRELQSANLRLRESEALLEKRVEERTLDLRIARDEADAARQRAEQSDQVKSQFLASMSHELRTPLNAILNFIDMSLMGIYGALNDEQSDVMQKSLDSGKHLLSLINDVLDITKIHSGMMKLFIEDDVDLGEEARTAADTAETLITAKKLEFVKEMDALPIIRADRRRVRQVLLNLLSNAAKFTERGSVTLRAKAENGKVVFSVVDTGPGIAEADQAIIFEPFQQTESGVRHAGGTGLGLPISKYLVEAHGGRLWLESKSGQGAAFHFELPINASAA